MAAVQPEPWLWALITNNNNNNYGITAAIFTKVRTLNLKLRTG
jgi:hypothetical protein